MRSLLLLTLSLLMSACFTTRVRVGEGGNTFRAPNHQQTDLFLVGGLLGEANVNVDAICRSGNATVVTEQSCVDGAIAGICEGWLIPRTTRVYCGEARAPQRARSVQNFGY